MRIKLHRDRKFCKKKSSEFSAIYLLHFKYSKNIPIRYTVIASEMRNSLDIDVPVGNASV